MKRLNGDVAIDVEASADVGLSLVDGLTLKAGKVTGAFDANSVRVGLDVATDLGPLENVGIQGHVTVANNLITGCFAGDIPGPVDLLNLGIITMSNAQASICFTPDKTIDIGIALDANALGADYSDLKANLSVGGYIPFRLPGTDIDLPFGTSALDTGAFRLPGGSIQLPDGSFQLPFLPGV